MIKAATLPLGLLLLLTTLGVSPAQVTPGQTAVDEVIRRQAAHITLRERLAAAQAAVDRHDLATAATLYDDAWALVQSIGPGVEDEREQTRAGLAMVRLELATAAQRRNDLLAAKKHIDDLLRVDPTNAAALDLRDLNNKMLGEQAGKRASAAVEGQIPDLVQARVKTSTLVQDGRIFFENGKMDEAEVRLKQAIKDDPENQAAFYYLNLVREARFKEALSNRDVSSRQGLLELEQAWASPPKRELLPLPNPYARATLINTSKGRQLIMSKLDRIRLDKGWDGLPLSEVIKDLGDESKRRDPDKRGINFIINPNADTGGAAPATAIDPTTGLPAAAAPPSEPIDVGGTLVKINPPLVDVRLADVLDAVIKVADKPIKYSIEDYAVVFSVKSREPVALFVRSFKVDPNTFMQGMESVIGFPFGDITTSSGGGGGGSVSRPSRGN